MIFDQLAILSLGGYCSPLDGNGVVASGGGGATVDTPMKVAEAGMKERHRRVFNSRVFPSLFEDGKMKEMKDHPKTSPLSLEMSQAEWEEAIHIVRNFGPALLSDANEEQKAFRKSLGKKKEKKWTKRDEGVPLIEKYKVEEYTLPDSDQTHHRLLKRHKRASWTEEKWLLCIPQLDVFDAISECHGIASHMKQNQTCVKVHEKYYNVTEAQIIAFVESCETCNHANPVKKQLKGAKKPILSQHFRDRFQVDLIDMRSKAMKDVYENTMNWILTLKDHFTQLTYLVPLPRKKASYVAYELDHIFGLIGYPSIFHTDNGKEFTANEILVLLKEYSDSIITVTGRPRTPRDQGSVESMNKLVKKIIEALENDERLKGNKTPNWTRLLGKAMQTINSKCGRAAHDVAPYKAVFGQNYHQEISCKLSDMRKCTTIEERLRLSNDDRLRSVAETCCVLDSGKQWERPEDSYWEEGDDEIIAASAPQDPVIDPSAATDAATSMSVSDNTDCADAHSQAADKNADVNPLVAEAHSADDVAEETTNSGKNTAMKDAIEAEVATLSQAKNVSARKYKVKYTVSQAMEKKNTRTRKLNTPRLGKKNRMRTRLTDYEFIYPTLHCDCCLHGSAMISVGDENYLQDCSSTDRWYESDFISSFGTLACHRAHTLGEGRCIYTQFITCSYPNEEVDESQCRALNSTTKRIVSAFHGDDHYVVADMDLSTNECIISDGLSFPQRKWKKHIANVLKRCKLIDRDSKVFVDEERSNDSVTVLELTTAGVDETWTVRLDDTFVRQEDGFNCGPLACLKMLEIMLDKTTFEGLDVETYRGFVTDRFSGMVEIHSDELLVSVPATESSAQQEGNSVTDTYSKVECYCGDDTALSSLTVTLKCCKKRQHAICAYRWLETSGKCAFCRAEVKAIEFQGSKIPIENIGSCGIHSHFNTDTDKVFPTNTPQKNSSIASQNEAAKCSSPSDEDTPLRQADSVRKKAASLKRKSQDAQAKKMIRRRSNQESKVGIGAVVTISLDKRDFSAATGVRAVVFDTKEATGGILACSEFGVICLTSGAQYWIPSDRYGVTSQSGEDSVLTDGLKTIRDEVLGETFDASKKTKLTLVQAQKHFTGLSPRKRAACRCKNGQCGPSCGCRKATPPVMCSSSCSCNGNCRQHV